MAFAQLDTKTRQKVLCAHCRRQIARISVYPENVVSDHALLVEHRIAAGRLDEDASERACVLESGWRRNPDGVLLLSDYARRRLDRARWEASHGGEKAQERLRDLSATRARRPDSRLGNWIIPPLPARVRCPVCSMLNTLDAAALDVANPGAETI